MKTVRRLIGLKNIKVYKLFSGNNLWPEFLKFLFAMASSPTPEVKEVALHMFASVPGVFGNQEQQYIEVIKNMLASSLTDQSYDVRFGAVKASCNYLLLHEKNTGLQKHFGDLLGPIMNVTVESVEKQDDDACIKSIIDVAETMPKYLRPQLEQIFALCLKMVSMGFCCNLALRILIFSLLTMT